MLEKFTQNNKEEKPYVIARCYRAGVHSGFLVSFNGTEAVLTLSHRLWKWVAKNGFCLSAVSKFGIKNDSKIGPEVDEIIVTDVCEIIKCTEDAKKSIRTYNNE